MRSLLAAYAATDPYAFSPWVAEPGFRPIDAGRGLALRRCWLVSVPAGPCARWLAPWLQLVIAEGWNVALLTGRWLWRQNRRDPRYLITGLAFLGLGWVIYHMDPLTPLLWTVSAFYLGFVWIIRPLWNAQMEEPEPEPEPCE